MNKAMKNILKILLIGLVTTIRRTGSSGTQRFRAKWHHAAGFYYLWDFCLLLDRFIVPAHPEPIRRKPDFAGTEIRPFLLRYVDCLSFRTPSACGDH